MSKTVSILYLFLILLMMGAIGFLGMQVSKLNDLYYAVQNGEQNERIDADTVAKQIKDMKSQIKLQDEAIQEFSAAVTQTNLQVKALGQKRYMPALSVAVPYSLFKLEETGQTVQATGDKRRIEHWQKQNEPFLEYLIKKSLPLEYSRSLRSVVVQDMVPHSVFYQMGLRPGDALLTVGGQKMTNGSKIRETLLNEKPKSIVVSRDNKRKVIQLKYEDAIHKEITLDLSKDQYNETLPDLLDSVSVAPAVDNGDVLGVQILELQPESILSQMNLKNQDIITKIGGQSVDGKELMSQLKATSGPIQIDILRAGQPDTINVTFND